MAPLTFIHAADIHLGRPFTGLERSSAELGELFQNAHYEAWNRVVQTALDRRVDFVTLGGDVLDSSSASVRARVSLRDGMKRLQDASIPVFMALGNHDPLATFPHSLRQLPGLHLFGPEPEGLFPHSVEQTEGVMIFGASFPRAAVAENLVAGFRRDPGLDLAIGVVHANVCGIGGHRNYAPCSLDDLRATGMDVWCLGHVHAPTVLCRSPLIIYPGTPQGAHVNESGPHGCYLISVSDRGSMEARFIPTAPVLWVTTEVDVTRTESVEDVLDAIEAETSRLADREDPPDAVVTRIILTGRGAHDATEPFKGDREFLDILSERLAALPTPVFPESLRDLTLPRVDLESLREDEGFLGDFLRLCEATAQDAAMLEELARNVRTDLLHKVARAYIRDDPSIEGTAAGVPAWTDRLNHTGKTVAHLFASAQSDISPPE